MYRTHLSKNPKSRPSERTACTCDMKYRLALALVITLTSNGVCFVLFLGLVVGVFLNLRALFEADTIATDDVMLAVAIGVEVPNTVDERIDNNDSSAGVEPNCKESIVAFLRRRFPT